MIDENEGPSLRTKADRAAYIYRKLTDAGASPTTASAILGNFTRESPNLDSATMQDIGGGKIGEGRGIAQHGVGGRFDKDPLNLVGYAKKRGKEWDDFPTQVAFILEELHPKNKEFGGIIQQMNAMPIENASEYFRTKYEKSSDDPKKSGAAERQAFANSYLNQFAPEYAAQQQGMAQDPNDPYADLPEAGSQAQAQPQQQEQDPNDPYADLPNVGEAPQQQLAPPGVSVGKPQPEQPQQPSQQQPPGNIDMNELPFIPRTMFKAALGLAQSKDKPMTENIADRAGAVGQGVKEIGQGVKQTGLGVGELLDLVEPGEQRKYTEKAEKQQKEYEDLASSKNMYNQLLKGATKEAPFTALTSVPLAGEAGLITKILQGSAGGALARGTEFVKEGGDRIMKTLEGAGEGALATGLGELTGAGRKKPEKAGPFASEEQMREQYERAKAEHEAKLGAHKAATEEAQAAGVGTSRHTMKAKDADIAQSMSDLDAKIAEAEAESSSPAQHFASTPAESQQRLAKSEALHEEAKLGVDQAEKGVSDHLNMDVDHDVEGYRNTQKVLDTDKAEATDLYNGAKERLKNSDVVISQREYSPKEIHEIMTDLHKSGELQSEEAMSLYSQLQEYGERESIPANDFVSMYKSVRGYQREAMNKGYQEGLNTEEQRRWRGIGERLKKEGDQMNSMLKNNIDPKAYSDIQAADKIWREKVIPLRESPQYWYMQKHGKLPANMMDAISGDNPGNALLRDAVKRNPEALKNVVGQRYKTSGGRDSIHNPKAQEREYTDLMPELQNLTNMKKQAQQQVDRTLKHLEMNKADHEEAKRLDKSYNTSISNIKDMRQQRTDLEKSSKLLKQHIAKLEQTARDMSLSKQQRDAAKAAIPKAANKQDRVESKLKVILKLAGKVAGVAGVGYGAGKAGNAVEAAESLIGD